MYTYSNENDTNKNLLYVYITVIFIMLLANFVGNIYKCKIRERRKDYFKILKRV